MNKKTKTTNSLKKEINELFNFISNYLDVDLLEKTRKTEVVEARSLFNYILNKKYRVKVCNIVRFYKSKNRKIDHVTIIHSINKFKIYKDTSVFIEELYENIVGLSNVRKKIINLENIELTGIQKMVSNLPKHQETELMEVINLKKKSWEWKNKDNLKIYQGSF